MLIFSCFSCNTEKHKESRPQNNSISIKEDRKFDIQKIKQFPIPKLASILKYYQTSGVVENAPSKSYCNPTEDGLFVFYTLFDKKQKEKRLKRIGTLITHTYYKKGYGWDAEDQDQTFIELNLTAKDIVIGKSIRVGSDISSIIPELGFPLTQNDTTAIFIGKDNYVCRLDIENNIVEGFTYGIYNFKISTNETTETLLSKIIKVTH